MVKDKAKTLPGESEQKLPHRHDNNEPPVDHLGRVRELAMQLNGATPSGAETIGIKILAHLDAHADPKAYEAQKAKEKAEADEQEARNAEIRARTKQPVEAEKQG